MRDHFIISEASKLCLHHSVSHLHVKCAPLVRVKALMSLCCIHCPVAMWTTTNERDTSVAPPFAVKHDCVTHDFLSTPIRLIINVVFTSLWRISMYVRLDLIITVV